MKKTTLRAGPLVGLIACMATLSACSQLGFESFSQDTSPPALNLATGCFGTINPTGKSYILTGCLTREELASLSEKGSSPALHQLVKQAQQAYQASLKPFPHRAGEPMLILDKGCVVPSDDKDRAYANIPCLPYLELYTPGVLTPAVMRKVDAVRQAHEGAIRAMMALPQTSGSDDFVYIPG